MLDAEKLQEMYDHGDLSEEEFVAQKKRLAAKIMQENKKLPPKNGIIYILLAFFLGSLGLHNFYAGYWGRALSQISLTLIAPWFLYVPVFFVSIWVLLELLFVGKGANGVPFSGRRSVILGLKAATVVVLALAFSYSSLVIDEPDFEEMVIDIQ